jgi:iron complex outermembrane receptor protein
VTAAAPNGFRCQVRQNLDGDRLPNTPRHKFAFNVNYTRNLGPVDAIASASYTWRSEQFGSIFERDYYRSPSNGQLDARVTFADVNDRYSVIVYGRNLTDEIVYEGGAFAERRAGSTFTGPVVQGVASTYPLAPPRTFGVELQYRFF